MGLDALVIAGLRRELEGRLLGARLERLFQPYRGDLLFSFRKGNEGYRLYFSADTPLPWVGLVEAAPENPASAPAFCMLLRKYLLGGRLLGVAQPVFERRLCLIFERYEEGIGPSTGHLHLELMGRRGNAVLVDREGRILDALWRKAGGGRCLEPGAVYLPPPVEGRLDPTALGRTTLMNLLAYAPAETTLADLLQRRFLGFSPRTVRDLLAAAGLAPAEKVGELTEEGKERLWAALSALMERVRRAEFLPCLVEGEVLPFPPPDAEERVVEMVPSLAFALGAVYGAAAAKGRREKLRAGLTERIRTHLARAARKREKQREELAAAGKADTHREYGELILAHLGEIPRGASVVELPSPADPAEKITVPLDPALSATANAQAHFRRYQRARRGRAAIAAQLAKTEEEIAYLEGLAYALEAAEDEAALAEIAEEMAGQGLLPAAKAAKARRPSLPRGFRSRDGLEILVGRNNRQNEELTFGIASPHDLWFHVRNLPGAHVILRCTRRENPPETSLFEAALLAVHFSRAREGTKVAVDYTERKHVRKRPGGRPGAVHYERFRTLIMDPEPDLIQRLLATEEKGDGGKGR